MDHKTYDSKIRSDRMKLTAPYYNSIYPTMVTFVQEKISVYADSMGHVEFCDAEEHFLGFVDFPVSEDPSKYAHTAQYGDVEVSADGSTVTVFLPIYYWTDNYPHCDGESDRWDRHVESWFRVVFDCNTRQISVLDRDV
ncbi:MAG: hypothetical protein IJ486_01235 [Firmicutes bacterium]|nr:hypothetical protein [Bacillota bacterium]